MTLDANGPQRAAELEAALRRIIAKHADTTAFWHQYGEHPTTYAKQWHDGFVSALATCSIMAREALDGPDPAEDAASGTDLEWFEATGNCGHCGNMARYCVCSPDDPCGCGPHELATEPQTCGVCKGRGTYLLPSEVVAARANDERSSS